MDDDWLEADTVGWCSRIKRTDGRTDGCWKSLEWICF